MTIPTKYYNLHHLDILTTKTKEDSGRVCVVCKKPIYRTYTEEHVKADGFRLSKVCTWDQYYTCCEKCQKERTRQMDYLGTSERDENGVPLRNRINAPGHLEMHWWYTDTRRKS